MMLANVHRRGILDVNPVDDDEVRRGVGRGPEWNRKRRNCVKHWSASEIDGFACDCNQNRPLSQ